MVTGDVLRENYLGTKQTQIECIGRIPPIPPIIDRSQTNQIVRGTKKSLPRSVSYRFAHAGPLHWRLRLYIISGTAPS